MTQRLLGYILVMFLSPILGLIAAFHNRSRWIKRWALIAFVTFFGSVISLRESSDGYRHWENVYVHYTDLSFDQFVTELGRILSLKENIETQEDPYIHILSYLTGNVLSAPYLFFVFVAFVYAYFFVGSLFRLFLVFPHWKRHTLFFLFGLLFLIWVFIDSMSTVRTWTGGWILFYACLSYYQTKKLKYLILMFVPPLIHVGYGIMALPAWIVLVGGVRKWLYVGIFVLSFFTTLFNPGVVFRQLEQTEVGADKVQAYKVDQQIGSRELLDAWGGATWYRKYQKLGIHHWGINFVAGVLILFGVYFSHMSYLESRLFSVGLLTIALSNSTWFLYALSNRSAMLGGLFILASILLVWQRGYFNRPVKKVKAMRKLLAISLVLFANYFIYILADTISWLSVYMLTFPFIPWLEPELNISIRQAISEVFNV